MAAGMSRTGKHMFPVEVPLADENKLAETIESMRTWLDHRRFEPTVFRYSFGGARIVFQIDFAAEAEAVEFARAFNGEVAAPGKRMAV